MGSLGAWTQARERRARKIDAGREGLRHLVFSVRAGDRVRAGDPQLGNCFKPVGSRSPDRALTLVPQRNAIRLRPTCRAYRANSPRISTSTAISGSVLRASQSCVLLPWFSRRSPFYEGARRTQVARG